MSIPDYSIGFTKEEVLAILAAQKGELTRTMAAWSESNGSVTKRRVDEIHSIIAACQKALRILDPANYSPSTNKRVGQSVINPTFSR
jgi:hypothetical protein